jgi:hypothetical protein
MIEGGNNISNSLNGEAARGEEEQQLQNNLNLIDAKIMDKLDLSKDQHLMSIRQNGEKIGNIEIMDGKITTHGSIGYNQYDDFVELIRGLQGFDIKIDDFYF